MSTGSRKTTTSDSLVKTKNELIGPGICERREGLDVVDPEKATISLSPRSACGTAPNTVVEEISTAQDWNGPGDFDNPQNWSMNKRIYHTILPGLFGFAV